MYLSTYYVEAVDNYKLIPPEQRLEFSGAGIFSLPGHFRKQVEQSGRP